MNQRLYTGDNAVKMIAKTIDDTDQLYAYNIVNYKVTELISEVSYSSAQKAAVMDSFQQLKKLLMSAGNPMPSQVLKLVTAPPRMPLKDIKDLICGLEFKPPVSVDICGSFTSGLALRSTTMVDVRLIIPKKYYSKKDYLDQRWLVKKAYYAAFLLDYLSAHSGDQYTSYYACPNDNPLDILLHISCKSSVTFRHHTEVMLMRKKLDIQVEEGVDIPTPLYNHVLSTNQMYGSGEELTADWVKESDVIKQCMILTKIWMHQRDLDEGFQCLNTFTLRMFMIYLLRNRQLPYHTSAHRMFLAFLQKIVSFDWTVPFSLKEDITTECLDGQKKVSEIVFMDPTGFVNYCAAVSLTSLDQLKLHAGETAEFILRDEDGSFEDTFIKRILPHLYYDHYVRIDDVSKLSCKDVNRYVDSCGDAVYSCLPNILDILKKGLGNRITNVGVSPVRRVVMPVNCKQPFSRDSIEDMLVIRFHVNPDSINNTLERGPPADDSAAAKFREFWGERAELRRFMDGAICEAVFWEASTVADKRVIYGKILSHLLSLHCGISEEVLTYSANKLSSVLEYDGFEERRHLVTGEEEATHFQSIYFKLSKHLRALKSLPLGVTDVLGVGPACRNTKLYAPPVTNYISSKQYATFNPQKIICVMEGSKWPDSEDYEAIDTLKMLIAIKMKESLNALDSVEAFVRQGYLTVFMEQHQFDISIMNVGELIKLRNNHTTPRLQQQFTDSVILPNLTSLLNGLQSQHATYATAARLLKKFFGSHMLTSLLPEPITDLIAASVYLDAKPYQAPRCEMVAFFRCLHLIANHDWANNPLVINFHEEINDDALSEIMEKFRLHRHEYPCLSLVTPIDRKSILTRPVMPFMMKLVRDIATFSLQSVENVSLTKDLPSSQAAMTLFEPDLSMMDVLIELNPETQRRLQFPLQQDGRKVELFMDPAGNYIKHIQESYSDKAVILYDVNNIKYVGLIWKPGAFDPIPLKKSCSDVDKSSKKLTELEGEVCMSLDINAVLQDCNFVGKDIVKNITVMGGVLRQ
ncbi:NOL6 [Bugula neritina]|uniref:Nucleolar protein 6 n=1 Tax=Bugula neritina TaxID=10212 RepID=A0A7J7JMC4_BUGNE|nr:NOL6 [Bugula neritina]